MAKRALLIVLVLFACVGCDQVTKGVARHTLADLAPISLLSGVVRLQYAENPGGFLSLGASIPESSRYWVFTIFVGFFLAGMLAFLIRSKKTYQLESLAISLMLGGGAGNLIDRVCNEGRVIDFMNLGIGSLRTGVFNMADMAISVGCIWLLALSFKRREKSF